MASPTTTVEKVTVTLRQAAGMVKRAGRVYLGLPTLVSMRITKKQARTILGGLRKQKASGITFLVDAESVMFYPF